MKRIPFVLTAFWLMLTTGAAQQFDDVFEDRTLRLDYVFAGDNRSQNIYFEQAYVTPQWAGRKSRLTEMFLRGNGQISVKEPATGRLLYVHTFSTLFQEWQATEEATKVKKAFQASYNVPMPKQPVDITVTLTDFHDKVLAELTHTVDPADMLIRPIGDNGIPYRYIWKGGSLTDCIDLAIVAEGYTEAQMDKFYTDCQRVVDALFAHEPFTSLKQRFNVVGVACPSADSGPSIPHQQQWRRTVAGTHYDTFYSARYLMSESMHHIYDLLSGVPFEHIIVLVNSETYGGGGIYNQLTVSTSDHPTFKQVLVHEFGHGYAGLGDEYFYDDGYETMYPADTEPWEPNLTTLVDFDSKWADMLPEGTPVPTPPAKIPDFKNIKTEKERRLLNEATQKIGVFEGGGYQSKGVFRPSQECRMKINEVEDFCPVCTRAIRRITDFYTSH
ncbi:MAG: peptidase M64 [Prevotella sp.]|nr:peptidase M64 [Prevotella sp.]